MTTRTLFGSVAACLVSGLLLLATSHRAQATDYFWTGAAPGDDSWNNNQNWHLVEFGFPGNDDTATIDGFFNVYVDAPFAGFPNALTIAGGSSLYTGPTFFAEGYELVFDNETGGPVAKTLITGTNSALIVTKNLAGAHLDAFDTDLLTVENGGTVWMEGSVLEVDRGKLDINTGGTVRGYGSIDLEAPLGSPGVVLENDGILRVTGGAFGSPVGGTLDIDVTSANGRIDLDGTSGNGQVIISWQSTLDIDAELNDPYSDLMTLSADSKLIMRDGWDADVNSTIEVNAETASAGVPDIATIAGGGFFTTGDVNVNSGTLVFEAGLAAESTARVHVAANSTIQFDSSAVFSDGAQLDLNAANTTLVVNGADFQLTAILGGTFNWDGPGTLANVTTVGASSVLLLNVDEVDVGNNIYNGTINNSGEINVHLINPLDNWTMAGTLNLDTSTGSNLFTGNMIVTGEVNVVDSLPAAAGSGGPAAAGAPGTAMISGDILECNGCVLNAIGGTFAIIPFERADIINGTVNVSDGATLRFEGVNNVDAASTWNLAGGSQLLIASGTTTVDSSFALGGNNLTIADTATLALSNVSNLSGTIEIDGGTLDASANASGTTDGTLNMNAEAGATTSILLPALGIFNGVTNLTGPATKRIMGEFIEFGSTSVLNCEEGLCMIQPYVEPVPVAFMPGSQVNVGGQGVDATLRLESELILQGDLHLDGSGGGPGTGTATLVAASPLNIDGRLSGYGSIELLTPGIELLRNRGTIASGNSAGILTVIGDYEQTASGVYEAEIGGLLLGDEYDNLTISGTATLDGELNLALINSFAPTLGNSFEILSAAGGVSGEFDSITFNMSGGAYLGGGLALDVIYNPTDVSVEVISVLLGDFDVDGDVDGFDFLKWQRGETPGSYSALDYNDWETNLGATGGPIVAAAVAIPEPSTCLLMAFAVITILPLSTRWRINRVSPPTPNARARGPRLGDVFCCIAVGYLLKETHE